MADSGTIHFDKTIKVGYLDQYMNVDGNLSIDLYLKKAFVSLYKKETEMNEMLDALTNETDVTKIDRYVRMTSQIREELESADFYAIDSKIGRIVSGLGIVKYGLDTMVRQLSGGQKVKIILAKLLLEEPDLLILDEPTNFLDTTHVEWLVKYLKEYKGNFLIVSHNQEFLNDVVNVVMELESGKITKYKGNYQQYLQKKMLVDADYEKKYLNNATYVKSLLQEYPELKRLLELKNNSIQRAECEIRKSLYAEKEQIQKIFCDGRKFSGTVGIYMSKGDIHRGGRSVAKVELDNGTILYYKPHSLDKNIKYQELYNYLCRKTGISCRTVQYLSHDSYGWEEKIENIPCKNESEVEHYYFRMGIHLFLGYALGATDLHGENIIAHGEYPVIIDMETYPGYLKQQSEKDGSSVEEKINKSTEIKLANSVIHTGMLPVLTWGRGNRGVLISAMGTEEKIKTPFKLPVVKDDKTSDIHIEYEPVEMQIKECIVRLNDQVINAADYTECIIRGFCRAYMVAMADKKVEVMLSGFFDGRSRVVLRHTQQYAMYLMASFHPDYMKSRECRKALLNVIHKEGELSLIHISEPTRH